MGAAGVNAAFEDEGVEADEAGAGEDEGQRDDDEDEVVGVAHLEAVFVELAAEAVLASGDGDGDEHGDDKGDRGESGKEAEHNEDAAGEFGDGGDVGPGDGGEDGEVECAGEAFHGDGTAEGAEEFLRAGVDEDPAEGQAKGEEAQAVGEVPLALAFRWGEGGGHGGLRFACSRGL